MIKPRIKWWRSLKRWVCYVPGTGPMSGRTPVEAYERWNRSYGECFK